MNFAFLKRLRRPKSPASSSAPAPDPRAGLGRGGEKAAVKALRRLGYVILAQNYDCPAGEIDLIARDGDTIVFVEVKTRTVTESPAISAPGATPAIRAPGASPVARPAPSSNLSVSRHDSAAHPQFSVRPEQQRRIINAARYFLRHTGAESRPARFDIVTVTWTDRRLPQVEHFPDAFGPGR